MFRTVSSSIIRSFTLYTQQWYVYTGLLTACEQDRDGTAVCKFDVVFLVKWVLQMYSIVITLK